MHFRPWHLFILLVSAGCGSDDHVVPTPIDCDVLSQKVPASAWAQAISPARSYRYTAGLADNEIIVDVLDEADAILGTLKISQTLEGDDVGTMVAKLERDGQTKLTMSSQGNVRLDGFSVRSALDNGSQRVEVLSRYENTACADEREDRPVCAGVLPIAQPEFTTGSCGLAWDTARAYGRQPRLASVRYLSNQAAATGGVVIDGSRTYFMDVLREDRVTPDTAVQAWLEQSGSDAIIGTDDEVLLTTAYNDGAWKDAFLERAQACENQTQTTVQALCAAPTATRTQALAGCGTAARRDDGAWGQSDKNSAGGKCNGGCVQGDPHVVSLDGHAYGFQGVGEYVLAVATAGEPFMVQARLRPVPRGEFSVCQNVSANSAVAFEWDGKRVAIYKDREQPLWIDGQPVAPSPDVDLGQTPGFSAELSPSFFAFGWPTGERVTFE
ncbi:MAG: hypothetical protein R3E66_01500 [bacterium]